MVDLTLLCVATIVFGGIYMVFFESPWLSYPNLPAPALLPAVHPGEVIPLFIARKSTADIERNYTMSRELHCDSMPVSMTLPSLVVSIKPGYHEAVSYVHEIPRVTLDSHGETVPMPSGVCFITGISEVNGIVRNAIPVRWYSQQFRVIQQ